MTRQEQENQAQLEWLRKWKERRKEKRDVRKKSRFYKILRKLGIIKDYEEDIRTRKYRHTLESSRDPAEPKGTLCCYGRASA